MKVARVVSIIGVVLLTLGAWEFGRRRGGQSADLEPPRPVSASLDARELTEVLARLDRIEALLARLIERVGSSPPSPVDMMATDSVNGTGPQDPDGAAADERALEEVRASVIDLLGKSLAAIRRTYDQRVDRARSDAQKKELDAILRSIRHQEALREQARDSQDVEELRRLESYFR